MNQFNFDLDDFEMATPAHVTGCIRAGNLYAVSSENSSISVSFANLNLGCSVLLDVTEHPACLEVLGEVPVSLTLEQDKSGMGYIGKNLKVLQHFTNLEHLPYGCIPVRAVLTNIQNWLDTCPYDTLRKFAYQVLGSPSIGGLFFSIPVSKQQHFSEPGGLARHSLEVAQMVYGSTICFEEHERWLAAVAGLLHEIGRVYMNTVNSTPKSTADLVSYEALNFEVLGPALQMFEKEWADGAVAIRHMLESLCKTPRNGPHLPITISIRSADFMSMSNEQRQMAFQGKPQSERFARLGSSQSEVFWLPRLP